MLCAMAPSSDVACGNHPSAAGVPVGTSARVPRTIRLQRLRWIAARSLIAAAVLVAHIAAIGLAFLERNGVDASSTQMAEKIEVVLLPPRTRPKLSQLEPAFRRINVPPPPSPESLVAQDTLPEPVNSTSVSRVRAEPTSPPFERLVAEAQAEDSASLRDFCNHSYPPPARLPNEQGTVVLLVRVEPDGHISDTTVEESSGSPRLDLVTRACVQAGSFEPRHAGWRSVASWQRVHWIWP